MSRSMQPVESGSTITVTGPGSRTVIRTSNMRESLARRIKSSSGWELLWLSGDPDDSAEAGVVQHRGRDLTRRWSVRPLFLQVIAHPLAPYRARVQIRCERTVRQVLDACRAEWGTKEHPPVETRLRAEWKRALELDAESRDIRAWWGSLRLVEQHLLAEPGFPDELHPILRGLKPIDFAGLLCSSKSRMREHLIRHIPTLGAVDVRGR